MFSFLLLLVAFIVAVESTFPYPPFNGINHHSRIENILDSSELPIRRMLQSNDVVGCEMADILNLIGLEEIQELIEGLAARKGVSPFLVLRKLNIRMRNKEEIEETVINTIDGPSLELLNQPIIDLPSIKIPPETSRTPYSLPPNVPIHDGSDDDTKVVIIPVAPPLMNRTPIKPDHKPRKETLSSNSMSPMMGKISNMLPGVFLSPVKSNQLRPPLGATVRVNAGDPLNPISRDTVVTVSPLMTVVEGLRQAEIKYQNVLGLAHDTDVITFVHSPEVDCFMVNSIDDIFRNDDSGWKVTVMDRDGQVVYDNFCLPSGKEILVKPGTVISLTYVPL